MVVLEVTANEALTIIVVSWMVLAVVSAPGAMAKNESQGVVVIYVQPAGFAEDLAKLIEGETDLDVCVLSDYKGLAQVLLLPEIRVLVFGPQMDFLNVPELYRKGILDEVEWFFRSGRGLVGMGTAGDSAVTGELAEKVFPLFGNYLELGKFDFDSGKYSVRYHESEPSPISSGIGDVKIFEQQYVVHLNSSTLTAEKLVPKEGRYSVVYEEAESGIPLVVSYEKTGRSVTFAGLNLVEEEGPGCYRDVMNQDSFRRMFLGALLWSKENQGYTRALSQRDEFFSNLSSESEVIHELIEANAERQDRRRLWIDVRRLLSTLVGAAAVFYIYKKWVKIAPP